MRHGGARRADDTLAVLAARARRRGCGRTPFALDDGTAALTKEKCPDGPAYSGRSASDRSSLRTLSTFHRA